MSLQASLNSYKRRKAIGYIWNKLKTEEQYKKHSDRQKELKKEREQKIIQWLIEDPKRTTILSKHIDKNKS